MALFIHSTAEWIIQLCWIKSPLKDIKRKYVCDIIGTKIDNMINFIQTELNLNPNLAKKTKQNKKPPLCISTITTGNLQAYPNKNQRHTEAIARKATEYVRFLFTDSIMEAGV